MKPAVSISFSLALLRSLRRRDDSRPVSRRLFVLFFLLFLIAFSQTAAVSRAFPEVRIRLPDGDSFSPNDDGYRDNLLLQFDVQGGKDIHIVDWQLNLYGPQGLVRSFVPDKRSLKASGLFGPDSESLRPPESLAWNGRDEKGRVQPDGRYRFELRVEFSYNRIVRYFAKEVFLDTSLPSVTVKAIRPFVIRRMSPDGRLKQPEGEILIEQTAVSEPGLSFVGRILDGQGRLVELRRWDGALPAKIAWNGFRQDGEAASPGAYRYELEWSDAAGNRRRAECFQLLVLQGDVPSALLGTDFFYVDPAGRSALPTGAFSVQSSGKERPAALRMDRRRSGAFSEGPWEEAIRFRTEPIVNLAKDRPFFQNVRAPEIVRLVGINDRNEVATSPVYFFVDPHPPVLGLQLDRSRWILRPIPSEKSLLRLAPSYSAASPIARWSIVCYLETARSRTALREWKGEGLLPREILWAGDTNGYALEGGDTLSFEFLAVSLSGRASVVRSSFVVAGASFVPMAPRSPDLRAVLALKDSFREDGTSPEGERLLDEVISAFEDIEDYTLKVRVYLSFQGEEEENLLRSEKLARSIRDALVKKGIPAELASFRGEGETDLVSEADDDFSSYRNSRVVLELQHVQKSR